MSNITPNALKMPLKILTTNSNIKNISLFVLLFIFLSLNLYRDQNFN